MILPIVAFGDPVLKKVAVEIDADYPGLTKLIADMFDTMYNAKGVGLAAPQVGKSNLTYSLKPISLRIGLFLRQQENAE